MDIESTCEMDKAWKSFEMKNKSFISSLFYGLQRSTVTCLTCSERSSTYEPFSNLSLIIPEGGEVTLVVNIHISMIPAPIENILVGQSSLD